MSVLTSLVAFPLHFFFLPFPLFLTSQKRSRSSSLHLPPLHSLSPSTVYSPSSSFSSFFLPKRKPKRDFNERKCFLVTRSAGNTRERSRRECVFIRLQKQREGGKTRRRREGTKRATRETIGRADSQYRGWHARFSSYIFPNLRKKCQTSQNDSKLRHFSVLSSFSFATVREKGGTSQRHTMAWGGGDSK